ncbi:MAG: DUF6129 family protein [Proteobacteria bacterium]|nr:DUF6129 family protein [Pseudomonadota bacterium]
MIDAQTIEAIAAELAATGLSSQSMVGLRVAYPTIHFTQCMDDDVGALEPYASRPGFNIYLVDGREHCMKFTTETGHATGLVLAEVSEDD